MRRMYSKNELKSLVKAVIDEYGVEALVGKDISVNGITSKGIANTGNIANIGDIATTGNISASGTIDGALKDGPAITAIEDKTQLTFVLSKKIGDVLFIQITLRNISGDSIPSGEALANIAYNPSSQINISGTRGTASGVFRISTSGEISCTSGAVSDSQLCSLSYIIQLVNQ